MAFRLLLALSVCLVIPIISPSANDGVSLDIKVDQVGYEIGFKKIAFLARDRGASEKFFELRRAVDSKVALRGEWSAPTFDPDSGDAVQTADFSNWNVTGAYYLTVPGVARSWTFRIEPDIHNRTYYLAARSFYGQRCGTAVNLGSEFPAYRHEACHTNGAYDASSGRVGARPSLKGWHDAGDYGRYVVNSGISTATLLWAVELFGNRGMKKIGLQLPESGNGLPDLLNEARWNIDWMLSMQDADGGVWHKQTSAQFCGFISPDRDQQPSLVVGSGLSPYKTSCATADLASVTAIAARVFAPYDPHYAERCLAAAQKAWAWLRSHPSLVFRNPPGIATGEYADGDCSDEQFWAAAELARTTAASEFTGYFDQHYREFLNKIAPDEPPAWSNVGALALWTYALGNGQNKAAVQTIVAASTAAADVIAARAESAGYRTAMVRKNYVWGSNGVVANYGLQLLVTDRLQANRRYREAAYSHLHYLLGSNPFSISYVTQVGSHRVEHIHHRPSASPELRQPWPGLLSGGPNPGRQDSLMQKMIPVETPPARAFLDLQGAYAANEVAINWNAPLVFLLAGLLGD